MVLVSEGLTDDDGIRIAQFGEDLLARASGEKVGIAMGAPDVQVGGSERSRHVFIADFVSAQAFNGCDARQFCYFFRHTGRNVGTEVSASTKAGIANAEAATSRIAARYPRGGLPATAGAREAAAAARPSTRASHKSRAWCTRTSYSRRPRAIASTGETWEASRAGE